VEVLEQLVHCVRRNPDARIAHGEPHLGPRHAHRELDHALVGELDGVRQQVEQDLAHALGVGRGFHGYVADVGHEPHVLA
jgi:hypothetical protein